MVVLLFAIEIIEILNISIPFPLCGEVCLRRGMAKGLTHSVPSPKSEFTWG